MPNIDIDYFKLYSVFIMASPFGPELGPNQPDPEIPHGDILTNISQVALKGIGAFSYEAADLPAIESTLTDIGFRHIPAFTGSTSVRGAQKPNPGVLHRHSEGLVIVHKTTEGSGKANFFWAEEDFGTYDETFRLNPETDPLVSKVTDVDLYPGSVVVFPGSAWHQFGADPGVMRKSTFDSWIYKPPRA